MPFASRGQRLLGQILDGLVGGAPFIVAMIFSSVTYRLGSALMMASFALLGPIGWVFIFGERHQRSATWPPAPSWWKHEARHSHDVRRRGGAGVLELTAFDGATSLRYRIDLM